MDLFSCKIKFVQLYVYRVSSFRWSTQRSTVGKGAQVVQL